MSKTKVIICPYCGDTQPLAERCRSCLGLFEPLSRQATHNAMGPWFVRNVNRLFQPGCSYETLVKMIERGQVLKNTIVRGPTTRQFWTVAKRVPGIAHLLGYCHNCDASVDPGDHGCHACGVPFGAYLDRNFMGLPDIKPLPWEAPEVEQASPVSSRTMDFRRAAEPLGLSSFASDDELRSTAMGIAPGAGAPGGAGGAGNGGDASRGTAGTPSPAFIRGIQPAAVAMMETAAASVLAVSAIEPAVSTATTRAMRRRLDQQQRTIRTLTIGLVGAIALAVMVFTVMMASRGRAGGTSPATGPSPDAAPAATSPAISGDSKNAAASDKIEQPPAATLEGDVQADSESTTALLEDHERAVALIDAASKSDRPIAERVADLEEARRLLVHIAASAVPDQRHADLDERLTHVNAELDRLRMQQMFP
jgi:hypothetical protein